MFWVNLICFRILMVMNSHRSLLLHSRHIFLSQAVAMVNESPEQVNPSFAPTDASIPHVCRYCHNCLIVAETRSRCRSRVGGTCRSNGAVSLLLFSERFYCIKYTLTTFRQLSRYGIRFLFNKRRCHSAQSSTDCSYGWAISEMKLFFQLVKQLVENKDKKKVNGALFRLEQRAQRTHFEHPIVVRIHWKRVAVCVYLHCQNRIRNI